MICLGIEGTAHTIGVGIVDSNCHIFSNYSKMYRPSRGIHPREAANHHASNIVEVIKKAIEKSGISARDLDLISFSKGPGLGPCLRTVATAARSLALSLKKPIIGANHCIAHLEIGRALTECDDPVFLYASGGNTQVISFNRGKYRVFGETLDIGVGNCLDKFGRKIGLEFPQAPLIEKMARNGKYIELPYSVKGMDVSFSGILTAAENLIGKERVEDICYSLQENCFSMLTEVTERAMAHLEKREVLLGGGVARNQRLKEMISSMAEERGATCFYPKDDLLVDNGAMIAWLGILMWESGIRMEIEETGIDQNFRTDEVEVRWH